jgi:competence protein ComEC
MLVVFTASVAGMMLIEGLGDWIPWIWPASGLTAAFCFIAWKSKASNRWQLLLLCIPFIAAWRCEMQRNAAAGDKLRSMVGEIWSPVVIEAVIESTPRWQPDLNQFRDQPKTTELSNDDKWNTQFEVSVVAVRDDRNWNRSTSFGRLILSARGRLRHLLPGDRVRCYVDWQRISKPTNPGQFDLAEKYAKLGIFARARTSSVSQVVFLNTESIYRLDRQTAWIVVQADKTFHRYVPFGQAGLASALVLNQRDQVEWEMQESLLATGTIHMLAISGMHIEMVAISVFFLCLFFQVPRKSTLLITMLLVIVYSLLCGGNPPVARAAIVVVVLGICRWIGKTTNALNLLGLAGSAILLYRPSHWLEVGTQLSFLAVAVLILLRRNFTPASTEAVLDRLIDESSPMWERVLKKFGHFCGEILHSSFWVWWLTSPLVLLRFHVLSPIAVILNLLLWIPLLLALLSGLLLLGFGWMGSWIGYPLGWLCGTNLVIGDWIVRSSEKIPFGHFWSVSPSLSWLVNFYVTLLFTLLLIGFGPVSRRWILAWTFAWFAMALGPSFLPHKNRFAMKSGDENSGLELTFIDVGHGTSVLIRTPTGKAWLYDAGRLGNAQRSFQSIADVLWHERIVELEGIFLSHADSDHFNAIPGLLKRFRVRRFITPSPTLQSSGDAVKAMLNQVRAWNIPLRVSDEGDRFSDGDVQFSTLHPPTEGVEGADNADSLCLVIEYQGNRILLPGDLEKAGRERLMRKPRQSVTLLMSPHHGSLAEDPLKLLDWCKPSIVVVSGGTRARNQRVIDALSGPERDVFITARDHAVRCRFSSVQGCAVSTWQHPAWKESLLKSEQVR